MHVSRATERCSHIRTEAKRKAVDDLSGKEFETGVAQNWALFHVSEKQNEANSLFLRELSIELRHFHSSCFAASSKRSCSMLCGEVALFEFVVLEWDVDRFALAMLTTSPPSRPRPTVSANLASTPRFCAAYIVSPVPVRPTSNRAAGVVQGRRARVLPESLCDPWSPGTPSVVL
jgi:hypothetical protein